MGVKPISVGKTEGEQVHYTPNTLSICLQLTLVAAIYVYTIM